MVPDIAYIKAKEGVSDFKMLWDKRENPRPKEAIEERGKLLRLLINELTLLLWRRGGRRSRGEDRLFSNRESLGERKEKRGKGQEGEKRVEC